MSREQEVPIGLNEYWRKWAEPFCGGRRAPENVVKTLPQIDRTETWNPLSHTTVIEALEKATQANGVDVTDRSYSLARHGNQMFGVWHLAGNGNNGSELVMGFRNSLDKSLAVGICAGQNVLVCSNLLFYGDQFIEFRKHSGKFTNDELIEIAGRAIPQIQKKGDEFDQWLSVLAEIALPEPERKQLTYDAVVDGVVPGSKVCQLHKLIEETSRYQSNVYGWLQAVTELWKSGTIGYVSSRSGESKRFLDSYFGLNVTKEPIEVRTV